MYKYAQSCVQSVFCLNVNKGYVFCLNVNKGYLLCLNVNKGYVLKRTRGSVGPNTLQYRHMGSSRTHVIKRENKGTQGINNTDT